MAAVEKTPPAVVEEKKQLPVYFTYRYTTLTTYGLGDALCNASCDVSMDVDRAAAKLIRSISTRELLEVGTREELPNNMERTFAMAKVAIKTKGAEPATDEAPAFTWKAEHVVVNVPMWFLVCNCEYCACQATPDKNFEWKGEM